MKINFLGTKVAKLSLNCAENQSTLKDDFRLAFVNGFSDEDEKLLIVRLYVNISSKEEGFILDLEYMGYFSTEEPISEEFKKSDFPVVNAPAIVYPFMRSFISTVTVNSGLKTVILPTVNFKELANQQKEENIQLV